MLKRTKGLFLFTMLVITGLAGTINDTAISSAERKIAVQHFKNTKTVFFKSVKGLSEQQLNYKASPERWSIRECAFHITLAEKTLWDMFEATMKMPATPEKRVNVKFTDDQVYQMITDRSKKATAAEPMQPAKATWQSTGEALSAFKTLRTADLKYVKSTTEDLRNHVFELPFGAIDGYQMLLLIAAHTDRHTQQINEVKADPGFPKK